MKCTCVKLYMMIVTKMLIKKYKICQTKKTKKALASFAGVCSDTKGLALFLYWSLEHGPEDSTVCQMLLNAYSMHPNNWPVTQQPTYPTVPSCTWCQTPLGKEHGLIYLPCVIHVTLSESVTGYMAKHSHRQERTFLTAPKIKGEMFLVLQKCISWYPCSKISLAMEVCFRRTCSSAQAVINDLKEIKKVFSERLKIR